MGLRQPNIPDTLAEVGFSLSGGGLFEMDIIFPQSFFDRIRSSHLDSPEHKLLFSVIEDALKNLIKYSVVSKESRYVSMESNRAKRIFRECFRWLYSDDRTWITSYLNICDILEINAKSLRNKMLEVL